ncbi:Penicillin-binding Protein dimerisation domain family [Synechococcus sp. PCC 7335]|uniref:peptidoglycan D,D-transpeptidase FtsI family protein n=1 Tax=Synechococcus sp. (strain ATCC 29403 / PCC 7335) TaxID=91464 RepID=UPI00017EB05C|nr:penicillin-binding protein 2 [Synechococcus sp. PCC 7335]EDX86744.1 Penicillin-binding Protein dimerisation domain family [Synechococcus sp. PCC 7335]
MSASSESEHQKESMLQRRRRRSKRLLNTTARTNAGPDIDIRSRTKDVRQRATAKTSRSTHQQFLQPRLIFVWGMLILAIMGLGYRLAHLQIVIASELQAKAKAQQTMQVTPRSARRQIVDRQGNVVAMDQLLYTLYVHPKLFKESSSAIATAISGLIDQDARSLERQFQTQESGIKLASEISSETAKRLRSLGLDGLDLLPSPQRVYPQGQLFSQVTGYVNLDGKPESGIELSQKDQLKYDNTDTREIASSQLVAQDDLKMQLTIDSRLQRIAQENLAATVAEYKAKRGALIVMDAQTGEILTLAVVPTYDPNRYYEADLEYFKNWAVSDLYEPGSTFKPINVAIALENGGIDPNDTIYDEGQIQVGGWPIQNVDYHWEGARGRLSITDVLRYSSNVGMVHIMQALPPADYYAWLEKLGIGQATGIELPGETKGQLKDREQFISRPIEAATTAFGQGFSLTPIQLVQLHSSLANGGEMVKPRVVRGLLDSEGQLSWTPKRTAPKQVFSPETTKQVLAMMKEVVDDGTGSAAKVNGYQIAGKTGTAQKATEQGSYGDQRITSFVGIAPVSDPRYVVLAVVDEPQGENAYGGTVAAPLVKKLLDSLVVLEGIAPDQASPTSVETESAADEPTELEVQN